MSDLPPEPSGRLPNAAPAEASAPLLEALWRAEELAGALGTAQREIAALRGKLAEAEQTVAELTELGDAAQAAIDRLRAAVTAQTEQANRAAADREAISAELFQHRLRAAAELQVLGAALYRAAEQGMTETAALPASNVAAASATSRRDRQSIAGRIKVWLGRFVRRSAAR